MNLFLVRPFLVSLKLLISQSNVLKRCHHSRTVPDSSQFARYPGWLLQGDGVRPAAETHRPGSPRPPARCRSRAGRSRGARCCRSKTGSRCPGRGCSCRSARSSPPQWARNPRYLGHRSTFKYFLTRNANLDANPRYLKNRVMDTQIVSKYLNKRMKNDSHQWLHCPSRFLSGDNSSFLPDTAPPPLSGRAN